MPSMADGYIDYTTRNGDTYDLLAIAAYNDEKMASHIIKANPQHMKTLVFEEGVALKIPLLKNVQLPSTLPPWRR